MSLLIEIVSGFFAFFCFLFFCPGLVNSGCVN